MKTRIIRTTLHDYEPFIQLPKDAKLLFLHLATCGDIGHTNIFYYPERKITYYLSLNSEEIHKAQKELEACRFALFYENYIWLNPEYAVTTSGEKNDISRLKEYQSLPDTIQDFFTKNGYCIDTVSILYGYTSDTTINNKSLNNKQEIINHKLEIINQNTDGEKSEKNYTDLKAAIGVVPHAAALRWQDDAFRYADYLAIDLKHNPDVKGRWLSFYKSIAENRPQQARVQQAISYLKDYPPFHRLTDAEAQMKYFFDVVHNFEKYRNGNGGESKNA